MRKIMGTLAIAVLALTACGAPAETMSPVVEPAAEVAALPHTEMLNELKPLLTTIDSTDAALVAEGYAACASLLFGDKDKYRESIMAKYSSLDEALDHLAVAAAGKQHLCP